MEVGWCVLRNGGTDITRNQDRTAAGTHEWSKYVCSRGFEERVSAYLNLYDVVSEGYSSRSQNETLEERSAIDVC